MILFRPRDPELVASSRKGLDLDGRSRSRRKILGLKSYRGTPARTFTSNDYSLGRLLARKWSSITVSALHVQTRFQCS